MASPAVPSTSLLFPCRIPIGDGPTSRSRRLPDTLLDSAAPRGASQKLRPNSSERPLGRARSLFACRHRGGHTNDDTFRRSLQSLCGFLRQKGDGSESADGNRSQPGGLYPANACQARLTLSEHDGPLADPSAGGFRRGFRGAGGGFIW